MVLVVVGDIQSGSVEPLIEEYFSSLVAPSETRPDPEIGEISGTGKKVHLSYEPEASSTTVSIQTLRSYTPQPDTFDRRRKNLHRIVATSVIDRRLEILSKEEGASFRSGSNYAQVLKTIWKRFVVRSSRPPRKIVWQNLEGLGRAGIFTFSLREMLPWRVRKIQFWRHISRVGKRR